MSDPVNLGAARVTKSNDNRHWTPLDCLQECAREIEAGETAPTSVMVLMLDDSPDEKASEFYTSWAVANLRGREMVFLMEYIKAQIMSEMRGS